MTALDGKTIAFVFPGQGSQKVGMGRAWADLSAAARRTFEEADDALGFPLSQLCWEGPEDELGLTVNTQPALLTVSTAIHRALAEGAVPGTETLQPLVMAGHSLGEYSALVAAGALDLGEALRLVRRRGQLMQEAVPVGVGAMAAVIGLDTDGVTALAADAQAPGELCAVANLNGPGQTVIAGHKAAVDRAVAMAKERGARKATLLAVSAPFHSPLMRPARDGMEKELARAAFRDPRPPVVTNVDAAPVTAGDAARDALVRQIDSPVRWVETVQRMVADFGVDTFLEVGPGTVLSGLNRRIAQGTMSASLADPEQVRKMLSGDEGEGAKTESSASS
jgi:[acyl-carrier-protein] S-malonyltransferase